MKNLTPAQIVFRVAVLIFIITLLLEILIFFIPVLQTEWIQIFLVPCIAATMAYFIIYSAIEKFIYRKIKLIYKNIHDLKSTKEITDQKANMKNDLVGEIQQEVLDWAEDKSQEINQLKKLEIYRKEFLGNVSHELKTPMTSIQGYLETLLDGGMEDPDINKSYLQKAMRNVDRMISIIDDLESIGHLESGELDLHITAFDIHALTLDVFDDLEVLAKQLHIRMTIKEGCDKTFMVSADEKLIREVLVNLVSNAIKYGKENGNVSVGFYIMGDNILTEVSDNGIGIAREHFQRVFERFYRIEKSRSRDFGGTGLGLSIVKHIIEAHWQTVNVRSTENEGSTFGFTIKRSK